MSAQRVLVIDDDGALRSLLSLICRRAGFDVDVAGNGEEALRAIDANDYLVAILDLQMPNMNGFDVIARLAARPRRPFIIVMTALPPAALMGLDPSVVQVIIRKPFDVELVGGMLSELARIAASARTPLTRGDADEINAPN
jgi:two-component system nitrogen regulation response regulator GlnG